MKKLYSLVCSAFLLANAAFAQSDEPCTATVLTVNNQSCATTLAPCINPPAYTNSTDATSGVTLPANTCGGFTTTTRDMWFKATVPASGKLSIALSDAGTGAQVSSFWDMTVYTSSNPGTCTGSTFTQIASECATQTYPNLLITQPAGTVVFIRVWREAASAQTSNRCFTICAQDPPPPPSACATNSAPANTATNVNAPKTMFQWSAVSGASGYDFYFGTTTTPPLLGTATANSVYITALSYNTTYYWYVVPKNAGGTATGCSSTMTSFTTMADPGPPANNECATATVISGYGSVNGTTQSATQSQAADATCGGTSNDDVWYTFTTNQAGDASITVTPTNNTGFDPVIVAYSGTCAALVRISCQDAGGTDAAETINLTGLTAATTYYLRVYDWNPAGSEGRFSITATGVALPVSLSDFRGHQEGSNNVLQWTTVTESNNAGFELQRSADGMNFSGLAMINTRAENGNSSTTINYSFVDQKPLAGDNFYRLKQVDRDGKYSYSEIVTMKSRSNEVEITSVFPNPAKTELSLVLTAPAAERVTVVVTDLTGKVVLQQATDLVRGANQVKLQVQQLAAGSYLVKAFCQKGCETQVQRFVKN